MAQTASTWQRRLTALIAAASCERLETLPVENYDIRVAQGHGRLLAHAHRSGKTHGAIDLIIAATAVATRRTIITTDARARFEELPGVEAMVVPAP